MFGLQGAWWDRWRAGLRYLGSWWAASPLGAETVFLVTEALLVEVQGTGLLPGREGGARIRAWLCRDAEAGLPGSVKQRGGREALMCGHHTPGREVAGELAGNLEKMNLFILHPRNTLSRGLVPALERGRLPCPVSPGVAC